jgi:hypothetical protein
MLEDKLKRMFDFDVAGVPPLKMVLVHARNDRINSLSRPVALPAVTSKAAVHRQEIIIRLIVSLEQE